MPNKSIYRDMAFVIMPSGGRGEYSHSSLTSVQIYEQIICPAIRKADNNLHPNLEVLNMKSTNIPSSIVEKLNYSRLVVADLTKANPNVTFELGIRWRSRPKCTVLISQEPDENPFDVAHYRSIKYDPKSITKSVENIALAIVHTMDSGEPDSGVFDALPELHRLTIYDEDFWAPFLIERVNVVIGSIPVSVEGKKGRIVYDFVAESIHSAFQIIGRLNILGQFDVKFLTQRVDEDKILDALKENIVFVGSRGSHPIGENELKEPNFLYDFEYKDRKRHVYKGGKEIHFELAPGELFGTIHKIASPFDPRRSVLVLAGNNRYATLAATRAVCGENPDLLRRAGRGNFGLLFKCKKIKNQPLPIEICDFMDK